MELAVRDRRTFQIWLLALLSAPLVYTVFDTNDGDIPLYHRIASQMFDGAMPYKDYKFEYPPYALLWFLLPGLTTSYSAFRIVFSLQILALDLVAKASLVRQWRERFGPALVLAVGGALQAYFYLKRLDAVAAALTLFALLAFARARYVVAGALVAIAVGTKLYPILLAPALLYVAWRRGKAMALLAGGAIGMAPLALLSFVLPWWRFAAFHAVRGLQVESTVASILWLLHFFGLEAQWVGRTAWMDVDGPAARALLPFAKLLFGVATIASVALSVAAVHVREKVRPVTPAFLARALLVPILAFMAFNIVLSPQYVIWLLGPAAIASIEGKRAPLVAIGIAVLLTTFIFPSPGYISSDGIALGRTLVLVARNASLVIALVLLAREVLAREQSLTPTPAATPTR
jgi:uncharacterized membrane protein